MGKTIDDKHNTDAVEQYESADPVDLGDDEPTIKLPRLPRITMPLPIAEPAPLQDKNREPLEYEHTWDGKTSTATDTRSAPPAPVIPLIPPPTIKKRRKSFSRGKKIALTIVLLFLLFIGGAAGYGYYYFDTNIQQPLTKIIHQVNRAKGEPGANVIPPDSNVTGKVWNILLLGSDNDQKYNFPELLTQVMMIVHIDTIQNKVTLVSIPRDSWVYVPEVGGMHKIDQAFFIASLQHRSFDDGVRVARMTVERDYGITIDRYAWVGLSGFASVIDTLGGVDINVAHPVVDGSYPDDTGGNTNPNDPYAIKRLYLPPGPQHLTGLQALEYVRSRHADLVGDIGRTQRQQQVLQALKLKLNATSVLTHLASLIADLNGKVYTDLSEQEMIGFAGFGHGLSNNNIDHITLGPGLGSQDYGDFGTIYDPWAGSNQDIVVPHCENIQPVINRIFGLGNNTPSCNVTG